MLDELRELASRVPFDERGNSDIQLEDISLVLLRDYLVKVGSRLADQVATTPLPRILDQMELYAGPKENRLIRRQVYHDCNIFGDKGYLSAEVQLDLFETANIKLECPYRLSQKDWKPTFIPFAKARKRIETLFSQLNDQFMVIRNYAKDTRGLFARIIGKISALTVLQYINYSNDKPIGRIKYALI